MGLKPAQVKLERRYKMHMTRVYGSFAKYNLTLMKIYAKNHPNAFICISSY